MTSTSGADNARRVVATVLLAGVAAATLLVGLYFAVGNKVYVVQTPSMGTYAPVGTLVLARPVTNATVHAGEPVLFTPPGGHETYFHRVNAVGPQGIVTSGDLNGRTDPWRLQASDITGVELAHVHNLGWLVQALPILLLGGILLWVYVRFFVERYWVLPAVLFGVTTILAVANFVLHPFAQATLLSKRVVNDVAVVQFVNTGLLPLDVNVDGAVHIAKQGVVFTARSIEQGANGQYLITSVPHFEWWSAALIGAALLAPTLISVGYMIRQRVTGRDLYAAPERPVKEQCEPVAAIALTTSPDAQAEFSVDDLLEGRVRQVPGADGTVPALWASAEERSAWYEAMISKYCTPQVTP